ncbi:hypothetical protein SASPL_133050 [Salvia splendens]|uniref:Thioredoxin domain-containing protein n=1 Tax=Salvia splendens TaxID=180675 RepID=A0A8X8ZHY7_SALSN|nr:hypothetical protein SASPL_133050 [Salvia splendens]
MNKLKAKADENEQFNNKGYIRKLAPLKGLQIATSSISSLPPPSTMTIAFAPTSKPLPPVRAITAAASIAYNASSSYAPCSSSFSNRSMIRLRNGRKSSPLLIKCGGGGAVQEIDESQFADVVLKSTCPVLVEFVATWCGPCRLVAPAVQSLAKYPAELTVYNAAKRSVPGCWYSCCSSSLKIDHSCCVCVNHLASRVRECTYPDFGETWIISPVGIGRSVKMNGITGYRCEEYESKLTIVKVDHDANPGLIEEYKVYGLPALIMFQNGKEIPESRREGAISKSKLKEYIDKYLESVSVV